jgi:hypothetical protein
MAGIIKERKKEKAPTASVRRLPDQHAVTGFFAIVHYKVVLVYYLGYFLIFLFRDQPNIPLCETKPDP